MMPVKVHVVGSSFQFNAMFNRFGWKIVADPLKADLVQFTGGHDVSPPLYGHYALPCTFANPMRDKTEAEVFKKCRQHKIPMTGVCRGGQFLNVMCGGTLYQDVDGHAIRGTHDTHDLLTGEVFQSTSTHHQMIIPTIEADILAVAHLSTRRVKAHPISSNNQGEIICTEQPHDDVEVCVYRKQRVLCFQPHPEFTGQTDLADSYKDYIEQYLLDIYYGN